MNNVTKQQAAALILVKSDTPKALQALSKCRAEGRDVLSAYLSFANDNPGMTRSAPSSRKLRHSYARHLSRKEFARGVRQLLALNLLVPVIEDDNRALFVVVPTFSKLNSLERRASKCR